MLHPKPSTGRAYQFFCFAEAANRATQLEFPPTLRTVQQVCV